MALRPYPLAGSLSPAKEMPAIPQPVAHVEGHYLSGLLPKQLGGVAPSMGTNFVYKEMPLVVCVCINCVHVHLHVS